MSSKFKLVALIICLLLIATQARIEACVSVQPARFAGTTGLASEAVMEGKVVHLLGYQNTAANLVTDSQNPGNAMLLPIPAKPGSMTQKNIVDTSKFSHFLDDIKQAVTPPKQKLPWDFLSETQTKGMESVLVFNHDIYTVVLAQDAKAIPAALSQVPKDRRPALSPAIFEAYSRWYPGWTFALCCFNTTDQVKAKPMLWWYEPKQPDKLFFPALDAHDGSPPALCSLVQVDHALGFSAIHQALVGIDKPLAVMMFTSFEAKAHNVYYSDNALPRTVTPIERLLPQYVYGQVLNQPMIQGDFVVDVQQLRAGNYKLERQLPPGATLEFWLQFVPMLSVVLVAIWICSRPIARRAFQKILHGTWAILKSIWKLLNRRIA